MCAYVDPIRLRIIFEVLMTLLVNEPTIELESDQLAVRLVQPEPDTIGLEFSTTIVVLNDDGTWYLDTKSRDIEVAEPKGHLCLVCNRRTINYHDHEVR